MKLLAFILFGVSCAIILVALVLLALSLDAPATGFGYRGWTSVFALSFVIVGLLITANRSGNPIGWVFAGLGVGASLLALAEEIGFYGTVHQMPMSVWGAWLSEWLWAPLFGGVFVVIPLVFPDGRVLTRRWRLAVALVVVASVLGSFWLAFAPGPLDLAPQYSNPASLSFASEPFVKALGDLGLSLLMASMALGALSLIIRFRRARGTERQQIKWLAFSVVLAAFAFLSYIPFGVTGSVPPKVLEYVMNSIIVAIPVCTGIAVMRYRLYDIDRVVSRTVSYAVLSALLGGTFALVVIAPTAIIGIGGSTPDWLIAGATLTVAAMFRPVRGHVQDAVDHRFNRSRYDAQHTIEAFTQHLREQIDIDALGTELVVVVERTMQPTHLSLWLRRKSSTVVGIEVASTDAVRPSLEADIQAVASC